MLLFHDILGHEQIKEHFKNAAESGKISHAYILSGETGMGKRTLADAFALTLLCEKENADPCGKCPACKQVLSGSHPDLIYVTHEKPATISVDDVREQINDTVSIRPYSAKYKIFIVDEAEKMTQQAQNALLKTIEEPPSYVMILLLTENPDAFLPTILSRCVQLKLKPLRDSLIKRYLQNDLGLSPADADIYSAYARGNLGKAISIASSEKFRIFSDHMMKLLTGVRNMDISELLGWIRTIKDEEIPVEECLDFMQIWYRDVLLYKTAADSSSLIFRNMECSIREISENSSFPGIERVLEAIAQARFRIGSNVNMELVLELLLLIIKES